MRSSSSRSTNEPEVATASVPMGPGRTLDVVPGPEGACLRLRSSVPGEAMEIELRFEAGATTVRLRAPVVEIATSGTILAECEDFRVKARHSIELRSEGTIHQCAAGGHRTEAEHVTVDASPGAVRLRANDDVQLLGELILLNCDRTPPMPDWLPAERDQIAALPPAQHSGDLDVLAEMLASDD